MKKTLLLITGIIFSLYSIAQTGPPPPPNNQNSGDRQTTVGQLQNNTGQVQSKSFTPMQPPKLGGSMVKPNPFMQTADLALIQNPTFESGFRTGFSYGFCKSNTKGTSSIGGNGLFTTDFTQRAVTIFKSFNNKWFYSVSYAQIGLNKTEGISVTRIWSGEKGTVGTQIGFSNIDGESFRISSPTLVFFLNKSFTKGKFKITPEIYNTVSNWYYDRDKKNINQDFTYNALVGTTFSYKITKTFVISTTYRGNMNTNPKFGWMSNILIGSNFKF